ncbi:MAG: hypothetical protein LCH95_13845 [Proteobacteria bacterium]|nr:hypothetical protein [Pseudomonadota bacterium]
MSDLVQLAIPRLRTVGTLHYVAGLLALNALQQPPIDKMPAAFVLPHEKTGYGASGLLASVRQTGRENLRVVLMIAARAPQGDDVVNPLQPVEDAVMTSLLGWQPDADQGALLFGASRLLDVQPTFFTSEMVFFRDHTVRA